MKVGSVFLILMIPGVILAQSIAVPWNGYGHDAQHTGLSVNATQSLNRIHWATSVDSTNPSNSGNSDILVHYGSPIVTAANTVLVPYTTLNGSAFAFQVRAFSAGSALYTLTSDYALPPHSWRPVFGPTLSLRNRVYYPGAGGTVYYRDNVDSASGNTGQIAFYGNAIYAANAATFNTSVQISTPLVFDRYGDIFFGFVVTGPTPGVANLASGVARISVTGAGSWVTARSASGGDSSITYVPLNCAPALSNDHSKLYFAVTNGPVGANTVGGYLVSVNSTTLAPIAHAALIDPNTMTGAGILSDGSPSPTVGPDGDVYYGVFESGCCSHNDRGWMLHFDSTLSQSKTPGSFGWDTTASIVPRSLVAGYSGTSSYLILTKYNNYIDTGGDGVNKVAVLDPNATMNDPIVPAVKVMREVITITGVGTPPVREWCINSAAIDPYSKSAIINSEDGHVYRWDFTSNSLIQNINLNAPIGEAYTPTAIGPDGTIYAINDSILYALGN